MPGHDRHRHELPADGGVRERLLRCPPRPAMARALHLAGDVLMPVVAARLGHRIQLPGSRKDRGPAPTEAGAGKGVTRWRPWSSDGLTQLMRHGSAALIGPMGVGLTTWASRAPEEPQPQPVRLPQHRGGEPASYLFRPGGEP